MVSDPFRKAEDEYLALRAELEAGRISRLAFESALQDQVVEDAEGQKWVLGKDDGKWRVRAGDSLVEANPYGLGQQLPRSPLPEPVTAKGHAVAGAQSKRGSRRQAPEAAPSTSGTPPRKKRSCLGGCGRAVGCLLLVVLAIVLVAAALPRLQSLLPGLRPGDCKRLTSVVTKETATGDWLTCCFGTVDSVTIERLPSRDAALQRISTYTKAQQQALVSLANTEGLADRSTWGPEAAVFDVRATVSTKPLFTKEGLLLYRDRYLIQVRLANWTDDAAMQARWNMALRDARKLVDAKFK